jgi:hypothetical protein
LSFVIAVALSQHQSCLSSLFSFVIAVAMAETIFNIKFGSAALSSAFSSRLQATRWCRKWLTTLDPGLQQTIGFRTVCLERHGWGLKLRLDYIQGSALDDVVAALEQLVGSGGEVVMMSREEVEFDLLKSETYKEKQTQRVGAVGNFERVGAVVAQLGKFMGEPPNGKPTKKQKRAALSGLELLNRSHRIGSAGLREAHSDEEGNEEGKEE